MLTKPCPTCHGEGVINVPIGERVRELREAADMTQDQLAKLVGISRPALANIEVGRQDVSTDKIIAFARTLKVSADHLLGLTES